jgi:hypothetical protein
MLHAQYARASALLAMMPAFERPAVPQADIASVGNGIDSGHRSDKFHRSLLTVTDESAEHRRSGARGQTAVEFALVIPLFLLLMLGVVQMVIIGGAALAVNQAAISCARYASLNPSASQETLDSYLSDTASPRINDSGLQPLAISPAAVPRTTGSAVTVTVSYKLQNKLFLGPTFFGITFPSRLAASHTMASE